MRSTQDSITPASVTIADVDHIIQNCFDLSIANVRIQFITPHAHVDHLNPEFFTNLTNKGYSFTNSQFYAQAADYNSFLVSKPAQLYVRPWDPSITSKFISLGSGNGVCNQELMTFDSPTGVWGVVAMPGHTNGTLALVNKADNYLIGGSVMTKCSGFNSYSNYFYVHSNAIFNDQPPQVVMNFNFKDSNYPTLLSRIYNSSWMKSLFL